MVLTLTSEVPESLQELQSKHVYDFVQEILTESLALEIQQ